MKYNSELRTIITERLVLRPFVKEDAEAVKDICNTESVYKNTLSLPRPYPIECALSWIANHEINFKNDIMYEFAITDKSTGKLYGCIGISNHKQNDNGEIGYWMDENYWGNGYATEACKAVIDFVFIEKNYHKVHGRYFAFNPASGRVMEKAGMINEGVLKDHIKKDGEYVDVIVCGCINNKKAA